MAECLEILDEAGIHYKIASTAPVFEISSIGSGGVNNQAMVMVAAAQISVAREALMKDARATIQLAPPPPDAYLATLDSAFLRNMLQEPDGWNFQDLAAAEWLLGARHEMIPEVAFAEPDAPPAEYRPVRAKWQVVLVAALLTGGIMGLFVGYSLTFSRQHGKDSPYHYDAFSRNFGLSILILTILAWGISISILIYSAIDPLGGTYYGPSYFYDED